MTSPRDAASPEAPHGRLPVRKVIKGMLVICACCVLLLFVVAAVFLRGEQAWRRDLLIMKTTGPLVELSWVETFRIVRPGSGFWMDSEQLEWEAASAHLLIRSPALSGAELEAGRVLFRQNCTACHGADGRGTTVGPSLVDGEPRYATSEWSTYRIIESGLPGTSMSAHDAGWSNNWLLVAHVRSLRVPDDRKPGPAARQVRVSSEELAAAVRTPENWLMFRDV